MHVSRKLRLARRVYRLNDRIHLLFFEKVLPISVASAFAALGIDIVLAFFQIRILLVKPVACLASLSCAFFVVLLESSGILRLALTPGMPVMTKTVHASGPLVLAFIFAAGGFACARILYNLLF